MILITDSETGREFKFDDDHNPILAFLEILKAGTGKWDLDISKFEEGPETPEHLLTRWLDENKDAKNNVEGDGVSGALKIQEMLATNLK